MIYNIEINLQDNMGPMAINNDQLTDNEGAFVVKDVDEEAEFEDAEEKEVQPPPQQPPPIPFHFLQ